MTDEQVLKDARAHAERYRQLSRNLLTIADRLAADAPPDFDRIDIASAFTATAAKLLITSLGELAAIDYLRKLADHVEQLRDVPQGRLN